MQVHAPLFKGWPGPTVKLAAWVGLPGWPGWPLS